MFELVPIDHTFDSSKNCPNSYRQNFIQLESKVPATFSGDILDLAVPACFSGKWLDFGGGGKGGSPAGDSTRECEKLAGSRKNEVYFSNRMKAPEFT
jgi:hypothetical protein